MFFWGFPELFDSSRYAIICRPFELCVYAKERDLPFASTEVLRSAEYFGIATTNAGFSITIESENLDLKPFPFGQLPVVDAVRFSTLP